MVFNMVILKTHTQDEDFSFQCSIESTIQQCLEEANKIVDQLRFIQAVDNHIRTATYQPQLLEIVRRVVNKAIACSSKAIVDSRELYVVIEDIKHAFDVIGKDVPVQTPSVPSRYTEMVCCKKVLDATKALRELYGCNDKLTLKVTLQ